MVPNIPLVALLLGHSAPDSLGPSNVPGYTCQAVFTRTHEPSIELHWAFDARAQCDFEREAQVRTADVQGNAPFGRALQSTENAPDATSTPLARKGPLARARLRWASKPREGGASTRSRSSSKVSVPPRPTGRPPPLPERTACGKRKVGLLLVAHFDAKAAVVAKSKGWWALFGLGEAGRMLGADIAYYQSSTGVLMDAHTRETPHLIPDTCSDWHLVRAQAEPTADGGLRATVRFSRAERSDDRTQDRDFEVDGEMPWLPTKVVMMAGVGTYSAKHAQAPPGQHDHNDALIVSQLRFHARTCVYDPLVNLKADPTVQVVTLASQNKPIQRMTEDTAGMYTNVCFDAKSVPALLKNQAFHIVAIDAHIRPAENVRVIHHFGFKGSEVPCIKMVSEYYADDLWFWTKGVGPLITPAEAGIRVGEGNYRSFTLQFHYEIAPGELVYDSSGVDLYITTKLRKYDVGVLQLGDPAVASAGLPVGAGMNRFTYVCPSRCTMDKVKVPSLTIFRRGLHMHAYGSHMITTQYDASGRVKRSDSMEYFDFGASSAPEARSVGAGSTIERGDWWTVDCTFRVPEKVAHEKRLAFGFKSEAEMCIDFVFYYPKQRMMNMCGPFLSTSKVLTLIPNITRVIPESLMKVAKAAISSDESSIIEGNAFTCHGLYNGTQRLRGPEELHRSFGLPAKRTAAGSSCTQRA